MWENKFTELWADLNISNTQIGKSLGIGQTSVGRQAIRLNLTANIEGSRNLQGYNRHRNPAKSFSQMLENYRKDWLNVIKKYPKLTRQELLKIANFPYTWLRKNDSIWIEKHLPAVNKQKKYRKLNWAEIDEKLSSEVKTICDSVLAIRTAPIRVSITLIVKKTNRKAWIEKRRMKLPLTSKVIDERVESIEDFMLRKIKWAEKEVLKEKKLPTRRQFITIACIRNKTSTRSKKVQNAITRSLNNLKKHF